MCDFAFYPSLYHKDCSALQSWKCPYPSLPNRSYCVFHTLPPVLDQIFPEESQKRIAYLSTINQAGVAELVCTHVEISLRLDSILQLIDDDSPIIIAATYISDLDIRNTSLDHDLQIIGCRISKIQGSNADLHQGLTILDSSIPHLTLEDCTFNEQCRFTGTEFGVANFTASTFRKTANFSELPPEEVNIREIQQNAAENAARFKSSAIFMGTSFEELAVFTGVDFFAGVSFFEAEFLNGGSFEHVFAKIGIQFDSVTFDGGVRFQSSNIGVAGFRSAEFNDRTVFKSVTFGRRDFLTLRADSTHTHAEGINCSELAKYNESLELELFKELLDAAEGFAAVFTDCEVNGRFEIVDCVATNNINAMESHFSHLELELAPSYRNITCVLDDSVIEKGQFNIRQKCYIQLSESVLGRVDLQSENIDHPIDYLFIDNTTFDGFDFSKHRHLFRANDWVIEGGILDGQHIHSPHLESTYSKAKEGAKKQGSGLAATEFFIKELRCRRDQYLNDLQSHSDWRSKLKAGYGIVTNDIFYITSRYAESPSLVFIWSVLTVIGFAVWYGMHPVDLSYQETLNISYHHIELVLYRTQLPRTDLVPASLFVPTYKLTESEISIGGIEYLILSIQSFTAFLVTGGIEKSDSTVRLVSSIQSFLGTFWIGLFVSTMVRSFQK